MENSETKTVEFRCSEATQKLVNDAAANDEEDDDFVKRTISVATLPRIPKRKTQDGDNSVSLSSAADNNDHKSVLGRIGRLNDSARSGSEVRPAWVKSFISAGSKKSNGSEKERRGIEKNKNDNQSDVVCHGGARHKKEGGRNALRTKEGLGHKESGSGIKRKDEDLHEKRDRDAHAEKAKFRKHHNRKASESVVQNLDAKRKSHMKHTGSLEIEVAIKRTTEKANPQLISNQHPMVTDTNNIAAVADRLKATPTVGTPMHYFAMEDAEEFNRRQFDAEWQNVCSDGDDSGSSAFPVFSSSIVRAPASQANAENNEFAPRAERNKSSTRTFPQSDTLNIVTGPSKTTTMSSRASVPTLMSLTVVPSSSVAASTALTVGKTLLLGPPPPPPPIVGVGEVDTEVVDMDVSSLSSNEPVLASPEEENDCSVDNTPRDTSVACGIFGSGSTADTRVSSTGYRNTKARGVNHAGALDKSKEGGVSKKIQEDVVEKVKQLLRPFYIKRKITKEDYKEIMRRAIPKICHGCRASDVADDRIKSCATAYINKVLKRKQQQSADKTDGAQKPTASQPLGGEQIFVTSHQNVSLKTLPLNTSSKTARHEHHRQRQAAPGGTGAIESVVTRANTEMVRTASAPELFDATSMLLRELIARQAMQR